MEDGVYVYAYSRAFSVEKNKRYKNFDLPKLCVSSLPFACACACVVGVLTA